MLKAGAAGVGAGFTGAVAGFKNGLVAARGAEAGIGRGGKAGPGLMLVGTLGRGAKAPAIAGAFATGPALGRVANAAATTGVLTTGEALG